MRYFHEPAPPPPLHPSPPWRVVCIPAEDDDDAVEVLDADCVFMGKRETVTGSENAPPTAKDGSLVGGGANNGEGQEGVIAGTKRAAEEEDAGQGSDKKQAGGVDAYNGVPKRAKV